MAFLKIRIRPKIWMTTVKEYNGKHSLQCRFLLKCLIKPVFVLIWLELTCSERKVYFTQKKFIMWKLCYTVLHKCCHTKGQLITKANSKIFIWTKKSTIFFCISALASKNPKVVETKHKSTKRLSWCYYIPYARHHKPLSIWSRSCL